MSQLSILTPPDREVTYKVLSDVTFHDLGMDVICKKIAKKGAESELIRRFMMNMTDDPVVTQYRCDVFEDLLRFPKMRNQMLELLEQIDFLKTYGSFKPNYDESAGAWDLLHRLGELKDYVNCVQSIYECLADVPLKSEGLRSIRDYARNLFENEGFEELKKDIGNLRADTSNLRSVTLGMNLNDRFEAESIGLISINSKPFTKAGLIANLSDKLSVRDHVKPKAEWSEDYKYYEGSIKDRDRLGRFSEVGNMNVMMQHPLFAASMAGVGESDEARPTMQYLDKIANHMISVSVKRLREILLQYSSISLTDISNLIPELIYYIRWAEYIESLEKAGVAFSKPQVLTENAKLRRMDAESVYNLKLLELAANDMDKITTNDIFFDERRVLILTGANRGGKTTITQAVGQLFVLAQGGIYVPGTKFEFHPVDGIYTHFPADEDKTLDLGRLGEECQRFRELYQSCTKSSLLLLNETFSTTSFEEGYYIAYDAVRAIAKAGIRTIYNTHMHKLAYEIESFRETDTDGKVTSVIVESEDGKRTYKVRYAPPEGNSYASDIARKYGVTYEQLQKSK